MSIKGMLRKHYLLVALSIARCKKETTSENIQDMIEKSQAATQFLHENRHRIKANKHNERALSDLVAISHKGLQLVAELYQAINLIRQRKKLADNANNN